MRRTGASLLLGGIVVVTGLFAGTYAVLNSRFFDFGGPTFGSFSGRPRVVFVTDGPGAGRDMELLEDFTYTDPRGGEWTAPKGYATDGATIPRAFWTVVGGPFEGPYRDAAIIHDWFCYSKSKPWQDVHRVFYYASRAAGVGEVKAKILYAAVVVGGPRWGNGESSTCQAGCHAYDGFYDVEGDRAVYYPEVSREQAEEIAAWVAAGNPTLDEIEELRPAVMFHPFDAPIEPGARYVFDPPAASPAR